jgi:hypothetical protein
LPPADRARCGRRPARELQARLRTAADGHADTLETEARRHIVLCLVAALEPIIAQIAQLTSETRASLHDHPDGPIFASLFGDPKTAICPAIFIAEMGDCRPRYPTKAAGWPATAAKSRRQGVRQVQACPVPMGLRPPPPRRVQQRWPTPAATTTPGPPTSTTAPEPPAPSTAATSASSPRRVDPASLIGCGYDGQVRLCAASELAVIHGPGDPPGLAIPWLAEEIRGILSRSDPAGSTRS